MIGLIPSAGRLALRAAKKIYRGRRQRVALARATGQVAPLRLLVTDPPILIGRHWGQAPGGPFASFSPVQQFLRPQRAWFLLQASWDKANAYAARRLGAEIAKNRRAFPKHRFVFLANTQAEMYWLAGEGISSILCNHNALADERIFRPLPDTAKIWDAVYNARLRPFKRHELAAAVGQLAIISRCSSFPDHEYIASTRARLAGSHWFNRWEGSASENLSLEQVNRSLNACRVGLCLSACEGAMMSSIEYLLAGLPVVSTRSRGGRDVFFDAANSLIVGDDPEAVAAAVRDLAARALDPASVRDQALQRMRPHRERLIELIETLCELAGRRCEFRIRWDEIFKHHMCDESEPQDHILRQLAARG